MDFSKKYRAIVKRPDEEYGHVCNMSFRLENLQRVVGGYIETLSFMEEGLPPFIIICNEEGKIQGLEENMKLPGGIDTLVGTIIVVGSDEEDFTECPLEFKEWKELVDKWQK